MRKKWIYIGLAAVVIIGASNSVNSIAEIVIQKIAEAIATAEGFFVSGSRPARDNNPGDLTLDLIGKSIGRDGPFPIFATAEDGWENLRKQVSLMFSGSHIYNPSMTIREIANKYTQTEKDSWAANVAAYLGVSIDTRLSDLL